MVATLAAKLHDGDMLLFDNQVAAGASIPCVSVDTWLLFSASTRLIPKSAICAIALQGLVAVHRAAPMLVMRQAVLTRECRVMQLQALAGALIGLPRLAHDALCALHNDSNFVIPHLPQC